MFRIPPFVDGRRAGTFAVVTALSAVLSASCTVSKQTAPSVSGPSEFGTSITLSASPEVLTQDGSSQAVISAFARDAASRPITGLAIRWDATASIEREQPVTISALTSITGADGRTAIVVTAPTTPTQAPATPHFITVSATPVSGSVTQVQPRSILVQLQPPAGVPLANPAPVAKFTIAPSVGIVNEPVTFDARTTTDDGEPCLSRCTYMWDFGDGTSKVPGMVVAHTYGKALPTGYTVTLTVVDERNGVGSSQQTFKVTDTLVVARFTVSPATPHVGVEATFDASGTIVGNGVVIQLYTWDFGDGDIQQTTTPTIKKRYDEARVFPVTLTVSPSSGLAPAFTVGQTVLVIP